jgi:hypothetical protein
MWIACVNGFFSTVIDKMEPGQMLIRARSEKDIKNLFNRYRDKCPSMREPTSDEARDYRWRLSIAKEDWQKLAGLLAAAVDYSNFKTRFISARIRRTRAGHTWKSGQLCTLCKSMKIALNG